MASVERLIEMTGDVSAVTDEKIDRINLITRRSRMLALNATIEASRVGQLGRGFAVVADEVKSISSEISLLTDSLRGELRGRLETLSEFGRSLAGEVRRVRGERLADLAHNAVEIADRNLYERSCDVRWWATDPAVVACAQSGDAQDCAHAARRLGVILDSYTVYLDLWIADAKGRVIATGRNGRWTQALGRDVSDAQWFKDAMATADGGDFAVADISREPGLDHSLVATYATAIRAGGERHGRPIGALGIFFDWEAQGRTIVEGVRLSEQEKASSRCLLLDSSHRVIASSDGLGLLEEVVRLDTRQGPRGHYEAADGSLVGYALTPGYETYRGLGWYGVIVQGS